MIRNARFDADGGGAGCGCGYGAGREYRADCFHARLHGGMDGLLRVPRGEQGACPALCDGSQVDVYREGSEEKLLSVSAFKQRPGTVSVFLCQPHACPPLPIRLRRTATTATDPLVSLTSGLTRSPRRCWLPGHDVCEAAEGLRGRSDGQAVGSHHPHERAVLVNHAGEILVIIACSGREFREECQPRCRHH